MCSRFLCFVFVLVCLFVCLCCFFVFVVFVSSSKFNCCCCCFVFFFWLSRRLEAAKYLEQSPAVPSLWNLFRSSASLLRSPLSFFAVLSLFLYFCLFVCLLACLLACLCDRLFVCLLACLFVCLLACLFVVVVCFFPRLPVRELKQKES